MQNLNQALFLLINAPANPNATILTFAKALAVQLIWIAPLMLIVGWMLGHERVRKLMIEATVSGLTGLLIAQTIGMLWSIPRPFAMGLGHQLIPHVADASFPSDHLTLMWSISFSFLMNQRLRTAGCVLSLLGIPMAWARIYLGVHFPLDMVGAAAVSAMSAYLCLHSKRWLVEPLFCGTSVLHQCIFGPLIRRGWLRG